MKKTWKEYTKFEKVLNIVKLAVTIVILCAAIMKFLNYWPKALGLAIPLFAVYYLLETIYNWKTNKDMAAIYLFITITVTAISCAVFFL